MSGQVCKWLNGQERLGALLVEAGPNQVLGSTGKGVTPKRGQEVRWRHGPLGLNNTGPQPVKPSHDGSMAPLPPSPQKVPSVICADVFGGLIGGACISNTKARRISGSSHQHQLYEPCHRLVECSNTPTAAAVTVAVSSRPACELFPSLTPPSCSSQKARIGRSTLYAVRRHVRLRHLQVSAELPGSYRQYGCRLSL